MVTSRRLLIATTNRGKLREVQAVLAGLPVEVLTLDDLPPIEEPVEDAATFLANAKIKAQYYASATGLLTLADDSGLEVDALNGAPGVHSSRYAGPSCDVAANNAKLVRELAAVPAHRRSARFRCVVVLADDTGILATADGAVEGRIVDEARGGHGFGYDPHFLVAGADQTMAQLSPDEKNRISHRGTALRAIRPELEMVLGRRHADHRPAADPRTDR